MAQLLDLANRESKAQEEVAADVTLICADRTLYAHACVLMARSEHFATMFSHPLYIEARSRTVSLTDIPSDVRISSFIHTQTCLSPSLTLVTLLFKTILSLPNTHTHN
jgi:hypothetical protein